MAGGEGWGGAAGRSARHAVAAAAAAAAAPLRCGLLSPLTRHPLSLTLSLPTTLSPKNITQVELQEKQAKCELVHPYSASYGRAMISSVLGTADGGKSLVRKPNA